MQDNNVLVSVRTLKMVGENGYMGKQTILLSKASTLQGRMLKENISGIRHALYKINKYLCLPMCINGKLAIAHG